MPDAALAELTAADLSFLRDEHGGAHMHVGGIAVFAGRAPRIEELREHVRERLHAIPRYRARIVVPPLPLGRPCWAVDPSFNLEYHVRHVALPVPGGEGELLAAAARCFSQRLDRTKPLWELWLVEAVDARSFAVVTKSHHALVDGIHAVDLMTALLDAERAPDPERVVDSWLAPPLPSTAQLVASSIGSAGRRVLTAPLRAVVDGVRRPLEAAGRLRATSGAVAARLGMGPASAPPSPLNVPIGPHRRIARATVDLADLKRAKDTFGGSVNDAVLAVVSGAVRHWMEGRGLRTAGVELRAAVPVAIEGDGPDPRPIALTYAPLPVGEPDPRSRLEQIRRATSEALAGRRPVGASELVAADGFSPPTVLAQASRLPLATNRFNLLVTNIPGPQQAMYLLGRRMERMVPVPFLSPGRSLAIAVTSYAGTAEFGLLGDLDKLDDLDVLAEGVQVAVRELVALADDGGASAGRRRR